MLLLPLYAKYIQPKGDIVNPCNGLIICFLFPGWVGSIVTFLIFALAPVVVYMYNRYGFRWCMFVSSIFYCLSHIITPFVQNMNFVFLTYAIPSGISMSIISTLSIITQREYFNKYFGLAIGVRYSANALGTMVMAYILPFAFNGMGFKHTFLCMVAFSPIILCYGLASRHTVKAVDISSYKCQKSTKNIYWELLQDRTFTLSLAGIALYLLCSIIPFIFMVSKNLLYI
jgi:MFS family permease